MSGAETDLTQRPGLPARPPVRTAAEARAAVTEALARCFPVGGRLHGDACLAATELVTNAIRHAGGVTGFAVRADRAAGLTIEVEDAADAGPSGDAAHLDDPTRLGGRGWPLVRLVSSHWEVEPLPGGGKRIRITLTG
ncbi:MULTISPECIES: ATP-binding protein [Kitasatospora]|uniref:Histidine kinase/HSP90-like ATPase domain-containing protein n=1 Tax=Kitasatospora setae (strain ATCC 33774 / DSM 43861 / JCM 3304 / KCC A-0304 / NBRC 14216 / KM-6054) TaxID=452652 RepID=E4N576_KITSK|nr:MULTISPECIES: ATP-binding protein [Kitasatospora]BAJ26357.1 hypothetical protein KSE_05110 [Kitasatospora setae KM-6054]